MSDEPTIDSAVSADEIATRLFGWAFDGTLDSVQHGILIDAMVVIFQLDRERQDLINHLKDMPDLEDVALWLDTYDKVATLFFGDLRSRGLGSPELVKRAVTAAEGTEVQDDLRSYWTASKAILEGN